MKTDDILEKCTELEDYLINRTLHAHAHAHAALTSETRMGTCRKCRSTIEHERWLYQLPTCLKCQRVIENEELNNGNTGRLSISYRKVEFLAFSHAELYGEDEPQEIPEI